jgi:hypothetical protein
MVNRMRHASRALLALVLLVLSNARPGQAQGQARRQFHGEIEKLAEATLDFNDPERSDIGSFLQQLPHTARRIRAGGRGLLEAVEKALALRVLFQLLRGLAFLALGILRIFGDQAISGGSGLPTADVPQACFNVPASPRACGFTGEPSDYKNLGKVLLRGFTRGLAFKGENLTISTFNGTRTGQISQVPEGPNNFWTQTGVANSSNRYASCQRQGPTPQTSRCFMGQAPGV